MSKLSKYEVDTITFAELISKIIVTPKTKIELVEFIQVHKLQQAQVELRRR